MKESGGEGKGIHKYYDEMEEHGWNIIVVWYGGKVVEVMMVGRGGMV